MRIGFGEILFIVAIFVLFFGGRKIPQLFSSLGQSSRAFKKALKEDEKNPVRDVEEIDKKS